jgi:hypothetical protein
MQVFINSVENLGEIVYDFSVNVLKDKVIENDYYSVCISDFDRLLNWFGGQLKSVYDNALKLAGYKIWDDVNCGALNHLLMKYEDELNFV